MNRDPAADNGGERPFQQRSTNRGKGRRITEPDALETGSLGRSHCIPRFLKGRTEQTQFGKQVRYCTLRNRFSGDCLLPEIDTTLTYHLVPVQRTIQFPVLGNRKVERKDKKPQSGETQ